MFMWHEGETSRGSQEIGFCLLKYIQQIPAPVKFLIALNNTAEGQNTNKNIIKFGMYIVKNISIETGDHKFLKSGHSYMECDQDFGFIEKAKNISYVCL